MTVWSSCCDTFYRSILEGYFNKRRFERPEKFIIKNIIDSSCCNISAYRNTPNSSKHYNDYFFYIPDTIDEFQKIYENEIFNEIKINTSTIIHKSPGNHLTRRINMFYCSTGNITNNLYTIPSERSHYTNKNIMKYSEKAIHKNLFSVLDKEIINSMETVYLYDNTLKSDCKHVVFKPSGVLNMGIKGLEIVPELIEDNINLNVNEILTIYPSCFTGYIRPKTDYFMDPYTESQFNFKIAYSWDGYTIKSKIYSENAVQTLVSEDLDILEMKSDNKSLFSTTLYTRNNLGIFVFRYYYDGQWKLKPLNNVSYNNKEKVYYMCVSPYLPDECVFLKTNNELMVYDATLGHERQRFSLSKLINEEDDLIQSVCYSMDNNNLVLGGNRLYLFDKRSNQLSELMMPLGPSITVTNTKWTERKYNIDYPSRHHKYQLSGRSCAFSNYWRKSKPSFWDSYTACAVHPIYNFILAVVSGISNSILIIDLRIPNSPVQDIPLPCSEFLGSRYRNIKWVADKKESLLQVFTWRQKYPIIIRFEIGSSFHTYSTSEDFKYNFKNFENLDNIYDTLLFFDKSYYLNFSNVDNFQEQEDFKNYGPLIENSKEYFDFPIHITQESCLTNLFHGYLGFGILEFKKLKTKISFVYTTSGILICQDLGQSSIKLKTNNDKSIKAFSDIDLEDEDGSFDRIRIFVQNKTGFELPPNMKFNREIKKIKLLRKEIDNKYVDFNAINLPGEFVKFQEQYFGDDKNYNSINLNYCIYDNTIQKFNSNVILERILSFNKVLDWKKESIIPLSNYEKSNFNNRITNKHNKWNPLDIRVDNEFVTSNTLTPKPQICSCQCLSNCDEDNPTNESLINKDSITMKLMNKVSNGDELVMDKGLVDSFGPMIILKSNFNIDDIDDEEINIDKREKDKINHRSDCQAKQFVCIQYDKENENNESIDIVDEILSKWILEHVDDSQVEIYPDLTMKPVPGDPIEILLHHKRKQKDKISRILSNKS